MKYLVLLVFFLQINYLLYAQWTVEYDFFKTRKIYDLNQERLKKYDGYIFPEFFDSDTIITYACKPLRKIKNENNRFVYTWTKLLSSETPLDSSYLCLNFFQNNVKKIDIYIGNGNPKAVIKFTQSEFTNGANIPIYSFISTWEKFICDSIISKGEKQKTDKYITINAYPINEKKKINFAIADLRLLKMSTYRSDFNHPFFKKAQGESYTPHFETNKTDKQCLVKTLASTFWEPYSNPTLYFNTDTLKIDRSIKEFFSAVFAKYPFYDERNLDKSKILSKYQEVLNNDTITTEQLWKEIANIILSFKDPHFYISNNPQHEGKDNESPKKIMGPIKLYEFYQNIYIAAIFDSTLRQRLTPGMKISKIDGIEINQYIDSLANFERGKYLNRRAKAISEALYRYPDDSTVLTVQEGIDSKTVTVKYNRGNIIPQEFKGVHCEFKEYDNGEISYYRINQWDRQSYLLFLNHIEKLKSSKGIILDLRNNPGGMMVVVKRFSSLFINNPKILLTDEYTWNEDKTIKETETIKPNRYYNLSHLKVTILANSKTACASEAFIDFMQKETRAVLIGDANTAGSFASVYTLIFPGDKTCKINCLSKTYLSSCKSIENKGITPDIWIAFHDVNDLAPYNDKLLQTAIQYLKAY